MGPAFGGFAALLLLAACGPSEWPQAAAAAPAAPQVSVLRLAPAALTVFEDLPGRVAAERTADIRPQVGGIVQRRLFNEGQEIAAGHALFQIDPAPFQAEAAMAAAALQRAQASLLRARLQTERLAPLVQADAVSGQAYDDAVSQRDQAAADVAQAQATLARRQLDLKFATVTAPIAGRIDQALVSEGALVAATDTAPMARIQQIARVYVDLRQSGARLAPLRAMQGTDAQILQGSGAPTGLRGRILFSGTSVDAGTGDLLLRLLVDNPQRQLLPGMYVQARVRQAHYAQALTVPQQAVSQLAGQARVWVVDGQQRARSVVVQLGELVDRRYRIDTGLSAGQQVVVEGAERLSDGQPVAPRAWPAPASATKP